MRYMGLMFMAFIFIALVGQAYAFSLSSLFQPILRVFGVAPTGNGLSVTDVSVSPSSVVVGNPVTITAAAGGDGLREITFYVNGAAVGQRSCRIASVYPEFCNKSITYTPQTAGTYTVRAVVQDVDGHTASGSTTFTVKSNTCSCTPHVSLSVTPTHISAGGSVTITANGYVSYSGDCKDKPLATRIRIYIDGQMVTNFDCGAPYNPTCTNRDDHSHI